MYWVRLTFPTDLQRRTGAIDVRRSLNTKSIDQAKRRCLDAERWFTTLVDNLRRTQQPTRRDIELAAGAFFSRLREQVDVPRPWLAGDFESTINFQLEETRKRIAGLEDQLRANVFHGHVDRNAAEMLTSIGVGLSDLEAHLRGFARQLAAKAEREQMRFYQHQLQHPGKPFEPEDPLFNPPFDTDPHAGKYSSAGRTVLETLPPSAMTLADLIKDHETSMTEQRVGLSHLSEFQRIARWLIEEFGADADVSRITTVTARSFRDKIRKIDRAVRSDVKDGHKTLAQSGTDDPERQIKSATAARYWGYVRAMFRRAVSEGHLPSDPTASLEIARRRDEEAQSPEAYTTEEVACFFAMPIFAGSASRGRRMEPGEYRVRDGHWWSAVLQAYTGMRGGELSQLYPSDFVFNAPVPHILIQREDPDGRPTKQVKNKASRRAVPIADDLVVLGLRQFVTGRAKSHPTERLFHEFSLGTGGKVSSGLSKYWVRHLKRFGLHKPGRATHVWRHTLIYHLRRKGVSDEDIGYLVGHTTGSQTGRYGHGELLARIKEQALDRLDYGVELLSALGGPYHPDAHRE